MTRGASPKRKRIFVAMPFRSTHDAVVGVIRDAAKDLGADVIRLDEEAFAGSIISQIRSEIEGADVVTAIVSEENGNVYYEIGLAHCQKKPVLLMTSDASSLPFDLRDHRAIVYDPHRPEKVREELVRTLRTAIEIPQDPHSYIESIFKGDRNSPQSAETGLEKLVATIAKNHSLQAPFHLAEMKVLKDQGVLAIAVEDFMKTTVRAIVDINGIVREAVRFSR